MRILFVNGSGERAGAERVFLHLLRYLDRDYFEPFVAFLNRGPFMEEVAGLGVPTRELTPVSRLREIHKWGATVEELRSLIREIQPDVVQANGEKMGILAGRSAKTESIPSVAWLQDSPGAGGLSGYLTQLTLSFTKCDRVIVCANWMTEEFNRRFDMRAEAIVSGCDLSKLPEDAGTMDAIRSELEWPRDSVVIGHFTRLQRWKGTETFIEAAARIKQSNPNARFLVVGGALFGREVGFADSLQALATTRGLEGILHFTGFRTDALEIMSGVDVVVHCSLRPDPFPTVVLEGMGLGKAVVASRSKGPEESLEHGRTGLLTTPGDDAELASALKRLLEEPELRASLGTAARASVADKFSAQRMASQFEDLYRQLLPAALRRQS